MTRLFLILSITMFCSDLQGQESYEELCASLQSFYQQKTDAEISQFAFKEKGKWMKYMPGVGFGIGSNSFSAEMEPGSNLIPTVSFNSRTIYQVLNDKQARKAQVQSIVRQNELAFNEDVRKLRRMLGDKDRKALGLQMLMQAYTLRKELMTMDSLKFESLEIKPSDWVKAKLNWMNFRNSIDLARMEIERLAGEIREHARLGEALSLDYVYAQIEQRGFK